MYRPVSLEIGETVKDPITKSDLKAHEVRRMEVYPDDQPSKVDVVGYVEPNKRIKQMIEAGIRIDAWNHALYDYENGEDDDDGFTMADERDDLDSLEMLSRAAVEKELYFQTMYKNYLSALKSQQPNSNEVPSVSESVGSNPEQKGQESDVKV